MKRRYFGAIVKTCGGFPAHYVCNSRGCADRIRRVTRKYLVQGGFAGARTIKALVDLIAERKGKTADSIIKEFNQKGEEMRVKETK